MKHGPAARRKFRNAIRLARAHIPEHLPAGYFLTDPDRTQDAMKVARALPAGTGIILRHFGRNDQAELAVSLAQTCRERGLVFLVAADPDLARRIGADGVHWPARLARLAARQAGAFDINTMSAHSAWQVRQARLLGMDGAIFSTVFPSESPTAAEPVGLARFAAHTRGSGCPVYALGGIDGSNVERTAYFGGFASVSGIEAAFA